MNNRFCGVTRMYTIINGLSFIESLGKVANHKALGAFPSMKLSSSFTALRGNSKSIVLFIEQERRIKAFIAFTDCDTSRPSFTDCDTSRPSSLGLLELFIQGAPFGSYQAVVLVETVKVQLTTIW